MNTEVVSVPVELDLNGPTQITVEYFFPESTAKGLLFCLPGGGCNRHYFDLYVPEDLSYSFARTMAGKGYVVVCVDHLGLGDSTHIEDGFDITVPRMVAANAQVFEKIRERYSNLPHVCVGHSMGASLGLCQQAWHGGFDAMVLLGWGNCGMPEFLCTLGQELSKTPDQTLSKNIALARAQFGQGKFDVPFTSEINASKRSAALDQALEKRIAPTLSVPASLTLVPNSLRSLAQTIELPTFAAMGDADLCGAPEDQRNLVSGPTYSVVLENTKHNHFLHEGRHQLYEELEHWLDQTFPAFV